LVAATARYVWYLASHDIPFWYLIGIAAFLFPLIRRIRSPAIEELRQGCARQWMEDESRYVPTIGEVLELAAYKEPVDARSAAPIALPDLRTRS
jgi:hypothetical protein